MRSRRELIDLRFYAIICIAMLAPLVLAGIKPSWLWRIYQLELRGKSADAYIANGLMRNLKAGEQYAVEPGSQAVALLRSQPLKIEVAGDRVAPRQHCSDKPSSFSACIWVIWINENQKLETHDIPVSKPMLAAITGGQHVGVPVRILHSGPSTKGGQSTAIIQQDVAALRRECWWFSLAALAFYSAGGVLAVWDSRRRARAVP